MNVEPKLSREVPIHWVGAIALLPEEAEQVLEFLPEESALRTELKKTLKRAALKAYELNRAPALED
jgi:hypothetical protein